MVTVLTRLSRDIPPYLVFSFPCMCVSEDFYLGQSFVNLEEPFSTSGAVLHAMDLDAMSLVEL